MIPPVKKSIHVPLSPDRAFDLFTARIADWWPIETHSVSGNSDDLAPAKALRFETGTAGRIVETLADGTETTWAEVAGWNEPTSFELDWHPGEDADVATRVAVTFTADADGCRVDLVHDRFEARGDRAQATHDGYNSGWNGVMECLAKGARVPA